MNDTQKLKVAREAFTDIIGRRTSQCWEIARTALDAINAPSTENAATQPAEEVRHYKGAENSEVWQYIAKQIREELQPALNIIRDHQNSESKSDASVAPSGSTEQPAGSEIDGQELHEILVYMAEAVLHNNGAYVDRRAQLVAFIASRAEAAEKERDDLRMQLAQRVTSADGMHPLNPYSNRFPAENWQHGYTGGHFIGSKGSQAEKFYKEGAAARLSASNPSAQQARPVDLSALRVAGWEFDHTDQKSKELVYLADVKAVLAANATQVPSGYAYRYYDGIRFSNGQEINGSGPTEAIPYFFGEPKKIGGAT